MENEDTKNELSIRKNVYTRLLINYNIKVLSWFSIFVFTLLSVCIYVDYYNGFKENTLFDLFKVKYLLFSLNRNLNKLFISDEITLELVGMGEMEMERLKEIIIDKKININLFQNSHHMESNSFDLLMNFKVRNAFLKYNENINDRVLFGEDEFEDFNDSSSESNMKYIIYVSFNNCLNERFKNTINIYRRKYSFFCLSEETSPGNFLILLNEVIEIWLTKPIQKDVIELLKYNSIGIYISNLIDTRVDSVGNVTLKQGRYYLQVNESNLTKDEALLTEFLLQLGEIFEISVTNQNKYLNLNENEISAFNQNNHTKLYKLFKSFGLSQNDYVNTNDQLFNLNFVNYYFSNEKTYDEERDKECCVDFQTNDGFLFTCLDINDTKYGEKILISWINYIRSLFLNNENAINGSNFEFKSKLGDKYVIKSHIRLKHKALLFTDWQVSTFNLIHSKIIFENTKSNFRRFLSTLKFYNIYAFPKHVIMAISYINKQLNRIVRDKRTITNKEYASLAKDSYHLLFNEDIFNFKTYNYDLIAAVYSPVIAPLLFIIVITIFRIAKYLDKIT